MNLKESEESSKMKMNNSKSELPASDKILEMQVQLSGGQHPFAERLRNLRTHSGRARKRKKRKPARECRNSPPAVDLPQSARALSPTGAVEVQAKSGKDLIRRIGSTSERKRSMLRVEGESEANRQHFEAENLAALLEIDRFRIFQARELRDQRQEYENEKI